MKKNLVKCLGKGLSLHENTTMNWNGVGMVLGVSLNVHKHLIDYLPSNRIKKGEKMYVYFLEKQIESEKLDVFYLQLVHDYLMKNAMSTIRLAKSKYYKRESERIKPKKEI